MGETSHHVCLLLGAHRMGRTLQLGLALRLLLALSSTLASRPCPAKRCDWVQCSSICPACSCAHVTYTIQGEDYTGYVALPDAATKVPSGSSKGALVAHDWNGLDPIEAERAQEMAASGYIAFALDMFGKGRGCRSLSCAGFNPCCCCLAEHCGNTHAGNLAALNADGMTCRDLDPTCAADATAQCVGVVQDTLFGPLYADQLIANLTMFRLVVSAGTQQLIQFGADQHRLVAFGYCFGGSAVFELARHPGRGASNGVVYKAVSGLHGTLAPIPGSGRSIKSEIQSWVQVHEPQCDPYQVGLDGRLLAPCKEAGGFSAEGVFVPTGACYDCTEMALRDFVKEMREGTDGTSAHWDTVVHSKAIHPFSNPTWHARFNRLANWKAHASMLQFFELALGDVDLGPSEHRARLENATSHSETPEDSRYFPVLTPDCPIEAKSKQFEDLSTQH